MKMVIVGSGIVGVTTAYYAAKAGFDVIVVDANTLAHKCSYANGGQISVCNSQVWNTWGNVWKGLRWLGKENAPLLIRPDYDPERFRWLMKFMGEVLVLREKENAYKTIELGLEARALYREIFWDVDGLARFSDHATNGILHIYTEMKDYQNALKKQKEFHDLGLSWVDVPASQLLKLEPRLIGFSNLVGGVFTHNDSTIDTHRFCIHLMSWLETVHGVSFVHGRHIENQEDLYSFGADRYVICAGTELQRIGSWFGQELNIYPVKGYSLTIRTDPNNIPDISLLDEHAKIVCSKLGDRLRVAGTAEFAGHDETINPARMAPLYNWVESHFPGVRTTNAEAWACLRPMRPDMLPIWGKFKYSDNVYFNGGHGHLGLTLAPATANKVIKQICNSL